VSVVGSRRVTLSVLAPVLAAMLVTGCAGREPGSSQRPVADVSMHDDDGLNGVVLPRPYTVPSVSLQDTGGASVDLSTDAGSPLTLVFFGYTHCPDICQVVMADIASALTRLDEQHRSEVAMVFVTTDPARDEARTLREYLDRFDPSFEGLTGPLPRIVELGGALDVLIEKGEKLPSGGYDVAHGTQIVGVLPDGTAPFVWTEGTDPASLSADIKTILDDKVPGL
jgi:protein SCO1/2